MPFVIWLSTFGLDFIFPIIGIMGHFANIGWMVTMAIIFIAYSSFYQHLSAFTIIVHIVTIIIGFIIALIANLPIFRTIELSICIEWLIINIVAVTPLFYSIFSDKKDR